MLGCACPQAAALTAIPTQDCPENIAQVQKLIFQRRQPTATPTFAAIGDAATIEDWNTLKAAIDATKVVVTPYVENVVIPPGAPATEGGDDNTTIDGNVIVVGTTNILTTGVFRGLKAAVLRALKKLNCEDTTSLSVFLINQDGKIIGQSTGDATTDFRGFPISSFFVGDPDNNGLNTHDKTPFQWNFRAGWRDRIKFVTPTDFDALIDL